MFARHHAIGAAIRLARNDGDFRNGGFCERKQQLRSVLDDAAEFLRRARKKAGHVFEGDERNVERVAEPHEPRPLHGGIDVEHAGKMRGLIRHDADRAAAQTREADDDVARVVAVHFEKFASIGHRMNQVEAGVEQDDVDRSLGETIKGGLHECSHQAWIRQEVRGRGGRYDRGRHDRCGAGGCRRHCRDRTGGRICQQPEKGRDLGNGR